MTRDLLLTAIHQPDGTWEVERPGNFGRGVEWGVLLALPFWVGVVWFIYRCMGGTI
jgi:hypothetical protein